MANAHHPNNLLVSITTVKGADNLMGWKGTLLNALNYSKITS